MSTHKARSHLLCFLFPQDILLKFMRNQIYPEKSASAGLTFLNAKSGAGLERCQPGDILQSQNQHSGPQTRAGKELGGRNWGEVLKGRAYSSHAGAWA